VRGSLERLAAAGLRDDELRRDALDVLRRAIPVDGWAWATADPSTGVAVSALADHPLASAVPGLLCAEDDATEVGRRATLAASAIPVSALSATTAGDLSASRRWREYLAPHGIGDELRIVFADPSGLWGYLDLYTSGPSRYTPEHVTAGLVAARALTSALRRSVLLTRDAGPAAAGPDAAGPVAADPDAPNDGGGSAGPPTADTMTARDRAVLLLDGDLRTTASAGPVASWLSTLPTAPHDALPCAVTATAVRALDGTVGSAARLRNSEGAWITVQADMLDTGGVAVSIGHSSPYEVLDLLGRAAALSARERDVVQLLYLGYDTRGIAGRLHIAETTTQDHIKKILAKSGRSSRRALLASVFPPPGEV